jgi:hypothetical protein
MNNKKSLLQDSLQELENIKNESLELAKEQLINESADLLEKKSAALFEKIIAGEDVEEVEESKEEESKEKESKEEKKDKEKEEESIDESLKIDEILNELEQSDEEEMSDDDMEDSDEMSDDDMEDSDEEEEMSLDALRKAAEEHGFKLVADDEEEMDSDEEEMDSDEEEMEDSEDEEDIEFGDEESDEDEFSDVNVDDKVLAEPSDEEEDESYTKINENFKRNSTKMRNTKKQVLKDLRDVSFNKLVEAYYNMGDNDSFIIKENEYMEEEMYDEGYGHSMMDINPMDEEMYDEGYMDEDMYEEPSSMMSHEKAREISYRPKSSSSQPSMRTAPDGSRYSYEKMGRDTAIKNYPSSEEEMYGSQDEEMMYEIDMSDEGYGHSMMDEMQMTDEEINEMLAEMDTETDFSQPHSRKNSKIVRDVEGVSRFDKMQKGSELEEMFNEMSMEELEEMNLMLQEDGDADEDQGVLLKKTAEGKYLHDASDVEEDYSNLTEEQIAEMLDSMKEEDFEEEGGMEESSLRNDATKKNRGNRGAMPPSGRPHRQSGILGEEEMEMEEEMTSLHEKVKKLEMENKKLQEGFTNKVKSLENKVYDVTISALKAGFVNKFLLEHPLRENEKLQIIHRFSNAQTKEQIKETYISLTNEFAKGQTVKDGSMLNESVQNKVGKIHRTDNAVVREKSLINENDESIRFKQLLNYNFGKKK